MTSVAEEIVYPDNLAAAFEHSITWEDDVWQADPVDVEVVHQNAREKFYDLLGTVTSDAGRGGTCVLTSSPRPSMSDRHSTRLVVR